MKKAELLKFRLREVETEFNKEHYDIALQKLEAIGKMIVTSLNVYNKKR
ncbi:hypothetical protein KAU51_03945 [Candidatus Parcubacteria bacterium]|nr:hypothetical protein [Candidatus Parcubacteria bacterium]